jgi:hypothetical protein
MEFLLGVLQNYSQNATNTHMNKWTTYIQ